jgi:hypothetical protein
MLRPRSCFSVADASWAITRVLRDEPKFSEAFMACLWLAMPALRRIWSISFSIQFCTTSLKSGGVPTTKNSLQVCSSEQRNSLPVAKISVTGWLGRTFCDNNSAVLGNSGNCFALVELRCRALRW